MPAKFLEKPTCLNIAIETDLRDRYYEIARSLGATPSALGRKFIADFVKSFDEHKVA